MRADHVEIVREIFDRWAEGDFTAGGEHLDRHVTFVVRTPFPAAGVAHGPEEIGAYMSEFLEQFDGYRIEARALEAVGDTVIAQTTQRGSGASSGAQVEAAFWMLFTFRGRRIVMLESIQDETEARRVAGAA